MKKVYIFCLLLISCHLISAQSELAETKRLLEDIDNLAIGSQVKYNIHATDPSNGNIYRMDALHIMELKRPANISSYGRYVGVYHHNAGTSHMTFQVHLATSNDLMNWTYRGVLLESADMPYIQRTSGVISEENAWIMLAHEQWEQSGGCHVAFKIYYTEDDLLNLNHNISYDTSSSYSGLEGTPTIISSELLLRNDRWVVDSEIGFHYNENDRDKVGFANLTDFGNNTSYSAHKADNYMKHITYQGATGNVGQRDNVTLNGINFLIQEGNIQGEPTGNWEFGAWRLWLYRFDENNTAGIPNPDSNIEGMVVPEDFYFVPIFPRTHQRSTAFGNPSVQIVTHPSGSGQAIFLQYFLMSEGASYGEGGPMIFYKELPQSLKSGSLKSTESTNIVSEQYDALKIDVLQNKDGKLKYALDTNGEACILSFYTIEGRIVHTEILPENTGRVVKSLKLNKAKVGNVIIIKGETNTKNTTHKIIVD